MTSALVSQLIQSIMAGVGGIMTILIGIYVPRGIAAIEARTAVHLTDQQRAAVMSAVTTTAGLLQTQIDQGLIAITAIQPGSPLIQAQAAMMLDRVPDSARAQGVSPDTAAKMIVARVDTSPKPLVIPGLPVAASVPASPTL